MFVSMTRSGREAKRKYHSHCGRDARCTGHKPRRKK